MLDFAEVGRRIQLHNLSPGSVSHVNVVSPIIGQLLDPEYSDGGVLLTEHECHDLAATIERQARMLDALEPAPGEQQDALVEQAMDVSRKLFKVLIASWLVLALLCGVLVGLLV